jgi:hypothetical protein
MEVLLVWVKIESLQSEAKTKEILRFCKEQMFEFLWAFAEGIL